MCKTKTKTKNSELVKEKFILKTFQLITRIKPNLKNKY